jgi:hypothetical protein
MMKREMVVLREISDVNWRGGRFSESGEIHGSNEVTTGKLDSANFEPLPLALRIT